MDQTLSQILTYLFRLEEENAALRKHIVELGEENRSLSREIAIDTED